MILCMRDAAYSSNGVAIAPPTSLGVRSGERVTHRTANSREAEILAMMAAALVRPTHGTVLIGEYDPRVQPVHCKLLAGFVPHDPLPLREMGFRRYIEYRAALWNIDRARALARAEDILRDLGSLHEAFAYPLAGALVAEPQLLVLDRPLPAARDAVFAMGGSFAVFETTVA